MAAREAPSGLRNRERHAVVGGAFSSWQAYLHRPWPVRRKHSLCCEVLGAAPRLPKRPAVTAWPVRFLGHLSSNQ